MYKLIGPKKNFEIWNLWNNYDADCGQLVGFINAGILDDAPEMYLTYWDRTLKDAQTFYDSLREAVDTKADIAWELIMKIVFIKFQKKVMAPALNL